MKKTMPARPAWFADMCKEQFDATDDDVLAELPLKYLYAVLAIGVRPERPPNWALQYASDEFEARDQAPGGDYFKHRNVKRRAARRQSGSSNDGELLDQIAERIVAERIEEERIEERTEEERERRPAKFHRAAKAVTGESDDGSTVKRLKRQWERERDGAKRIRRASYRLAMKSTDA